MEKSNKNNIVKIMLKDGAVLPKQAHKEDVGFDVYATSCEYSEEYDMYIYHTGLYVETNNNDEGKVNSLYGFPRSSNSKTECYLTNGVGIIDSDIYRGEIQARFKNRTSIDVMAHIETLKQLLSDAINNSIIVPYEEMFEHKKEELVNRAKNLEFAPYPLDKAVFQLVYAEETKPVFKQVKEINLDTERGASGFGSSDKK